MKIDNEFTVSVPIERAWEVLTDLAGIAPCLPGAKLTGVDGDVYTGKVKIKVGPVISEYAGTARFAEKDDVAHRAVIDAKGKDSRGAGNASATIDASLRADGERTVVTVATDLTISGKIAQFGSGMIKDVSTKLLGQFVDNLETKLLAPTAEVTESEAPAANGTPAETPVSIAETPAAATPAPELAPVEGPTDQPDPVADDEPEPLDLMSMAGGSVARRAIPVALAVLAVAALVRYLLARR